MLEKVWEIDNEVRISKEPEMKRNFNRNQKHNSMRHPAKPSNILGYMKAIS